MGLKTAVISGAIIVVKQLAPDAIKMGQKISAEFIEKQKSLVKIPDLRDVNVQEALRVLKDELKLTSTSAIANPCVAYADERVNDVMYTKPRFGARVNPNTTVKVYYLTQEVIDKSKELLKSAAEEFKVPHVIGLNIFDAQEDLEGLGVKAYEKLEKPNLRFFDKEDGQVTKVTYANKKIIGSKLRVGERVWLYYVNEEVIMASKTLKEDKDKERQERIDKIVKVAKEVPQKIYNGAVEAPQEITKNIKKPFAKKK